MNCPHEPSPAPGAAAVLPALPPGVRLITLEHGLTLIVGEDPSAPVVSAQAWCRAGSIHEDRWLGAGLSHVLEHMLFKGTTTRPGSRIDQEVQEAGGAMNAYTSFDRTVYWINVPSTGTRVALDILADIMQHATLPEEELAKEMDVIRREMDMCRDNPAQHSARRLFETAYTVSPYRYTVIGYPEIFNQLTRADVLGYYREKYVPNNLFFVVVGDVKADAVVEQLRAAFAGARARPLPPVVLPVEPRQVAPRELFEEGATELAHLHFAWHIPEVRHPDVPVLDVLSGLLGQGRSCRLYQQVRERRGLVTSIEAWTYNPGGEGLLGISATCEADKFPAASAAILAEVDRLQQDLADPAELTKAVKQFVAATLATRKTMQGQAQDLGGNWLVAGDLNFSARYLERVKAVTAEDVRRVARTYLTPENRTHYALLPKGHAPGAGASVSAPAERPVTLVRLPNGLRLLLKADTRLPFVEFRLVLLGGVLTETPATSGVSQLLARMWMQGTTRRSAEDLARTIESVGGHLDTYSGNHSLGLTAEVLREDFALGLELLAEVLRQPAFPADALERERQMQLAALRAQKDHLLHVAFRRMCRQLFGEASYGLDPLGTEASVSTLGLEDLRRCQDRLVSPDRAVLAIYGDVDPDAAAPAVEKVLGDWTPVPGPDPARPRPPAAGRVTETADKQQSVLVVGYPGTTLHDPDRYALDLIQEACSDLGSRLFLRVRDRLGLAYYVGAQHFPGLAPGYFAFYAGTAPAHAAQVEAELLAEALALRAGGLTPEELRRAQAKVIGQRKIARQDLGQLAMTQALDELYGLGYANTDAEDARFAAVTVEQTRAVAEKYLRPEAAVIAVVGGTATREAT
jgi:zinc protease